MKTLRLDEILALSKNPRLRTQPIAFDPIDFSLPFVHESLTPLYFAPQYVTLSRPQRLRYNQLAGMKINEQFIMLELELVDRILPRLLQHPAVNDCPDLRECLLQMCNEERVHLEMFRCLNRMCLPAYLNEDFYFGRLGYLPRLLLRLMTRAPHRFAFVLWLQLLIEEYTVGFSRCMMRSRTTETLGELEPNFQRIHREHVKDEFRHVHVDTWVLELFTACSSTHRSLDAALFSWCVRNLTAPTVSFKVIRHLAREYPELRRRETELVKALAAVARQEAYQRSLFSRTLTPITFALLDSQSEFHRLSAVLPEYTPSLSRTVPPSAPHVH